MSYKPTTWVDGETQVNAEHLNNLESGVKANADAIENLGTTAYKDSMANYVLSKLPIWEGGSY